MSVGEAYSFESHLEVIDYGRMEYRVIYLPVELVSRLTFDKGQRLRICGTLNGTMISGAINPSKSGHYIMVSKKLQRICALNVGDAAFIEFEIDSAEAVDIPAELERALWANDAARKAWSLLTPGKKRGHCHLVNSAKLSKTKQKRIEELIDLLTSTQTQT